jgi:myo-inositol 2-dehydrogenase/D-chiro-inositol 1-dehydrogenase
VTLELPADLRGSSRLVRRAADGSQSINELDDWDPHRAVLAVLDDAATGRDAHPDLHDGTRAMEVSEGVVRGLRRGRTVELHYEQISEAGTFKSVMTSLGCLLLISALILLPLALAGPALGIGWTIYIAYAIPPVLVAFVLLQTLRYAIRDPGAGNPDADS